MLVGTWNGIGWAFMIGLTVIGAWSRVSIDFGRRAGVKLTYLSWSHLDLGFSKKERSMLD